MYREPADAPEPVEDALLVATGVKLTDTLGLLMALRTKADNDWYRVIYLHAALIAVMVFFAGETEEYLLARLVVFAFYSFNVAVSFAALRETYQGLRHATADLDSFAPHQGGAGIQRWLGGRDYGRTLRLQLTVLSAAWLVVAYLLLAKVLLGWTP